MAHLANFFKFVVRNLACVAGGLVGARSKNSEAALPRKRAAEPQESGAGSSERPPVFSLAARCRGFAAHFPALYLV